jgi:DNA processing protein
LNKEIEFWLMLSRIENLRPQKKLELVMTLGNASKVYEADAGMLMRAGFSKQQYDHFHGDEIRTEVNRILETCGKKRIDILTISDEEYPEMLKYISDPPLVLYVRGYIPKSNSIAIVGSRKASGYGIETANKMAFNLALADINIVSGMARGIDTAAHAGALEADGETVAVLGCGVDVAYPPENRSLMERISDSGAVISEFPPGTPPSPMNFPGRNRIISGMSIGTLIVEAGMKSGSLITANYALEQGRDVFAIPGNINNYNSMGTNRLIKDGAKIVLSVDDILDELSFGSSPLVKKSRKRKKNRTANLGVKEKKIINALKIEDLFDEELSEKTSIQLIELFEILLELELNGLVKKSINGKYMLIS